MSWGRQSDTWTFHPRVMRLGRGGDDRQLNEAAGAIGRLLAYTGGVDSDGHVPEEIAHLVLDPHYDRLIKVLRREGFIDPKMVNHPEHGRGIHVVIDHPDLLLHNMSKAEKATRQSDSRRWPEGVKWQIIRRDGDQCRYCGIAVNPNDRRGGQQRHLDHLVNDGPRTVENGVVACSECNGRKQNGEPIEPLRPPPSQPYYHKDTLRKLAEMFPDTRPTDDSRTARPVVDIAQRDPGDFDGSIRAHLDEIAAADPNPTRGGGPVVSRVGSGLAGPSRAGPGRDGSVARSRGSRGGRRRNRNA